MKRRLVWSALVIAMLALALGAPLASAQSDQPSEPGLVIVRVDAGGPAAEAGVKRGDILLALDDQEINRPADWLLAMRGLEAGQQVDLQVLHGDDERTLTATVAERNSRPFLGLQVYLGGAVEDVVQEPLLLPLMSATVGAQVAEVVDDSPASAAGLQVGDVITAVDGRELGGESSLAEIIGAYQPGDVVSLTVARGDAGEETLELEVTLGANPDDAERAFLGIRFNEIAAFQDMQDQIMPFFQERGDRMMPFGRGFGQTVPETPAMPDDRITAGAIVRAVVADGPAANAGLQDSDVITALDGEAVDGPQALIDAVAARQPGDTVTLTVTRAGEDAELEIEVVLGENPDSADKAYLGVSIGAYMMRFQDGVPGNRGGMRFQLPFGLGEMEIDPDQLPFNLDQLPFDLDQLPFDLPFDLPGLQQPNRPEA